jgi:hypothetical protein
MQLFMRSNMNELRQLIDAERYRTKRPLLIFIDECQFVSEQKRWGAALAEAQNLGCLLVLLTATPIRDDGEAIPGFDRVVLNEKDETRYVVTDAGDGKNNKIDVWLGSRELVKLNADHETTFQEAWNEKPAPLCHLTREVMDPEFESAEGAVMRLSELSPARSRAELGQAVRRPRFIEYGVLKGLEALAIAQRINQKCAAIVFVGNDQPGDARDDAHAKAVREQFLQHGPRFLGHKPETLIVTMKSSEDETCSRKLEGFVGVNGAEGRGDVLIVKQIGGAGLDCPRLKVLIDFSSVRTVAGVVQRLTRIATPFEGIKIGTVITAADATMQALWDKLIVAEGGELNEVAQWVPDAFERSYLKPKSPPPEDDDPLRMGDTMIGGYDDSHGNIGPMAMYAAVNEFIAEFPELLAHHTKPEVAKRVARLSFVPGVASRPEERICRTTQDAAEEVRAEIRELTEQLIRDRFRASGQEYSSDAYGETARAVWTPAYVACGVPRNSELKSITNLDTLTRLRSYFQGQGRTL